MQRLIRSIVISFEGGIGSSLDRFLLCIFLCFISFNGLSRLIATIITPIITTLRLLCLLWRHAHLCRRWLLLLHSHSLDWVCRQCFLWRSLDRLAKDPTLRPAWLRRMLSLGVMSNPGICLEIIRQASSQLLHIVLQMMRTELLISVTLPDTLALTRILDCYLLFKLIS